MERKDEEGAQNRLRVLFVDVVPGNIHFIAEREKVGGKTHGRGERRPADKAVRNGLELDDRHLDDRLGIPVVALHEGFRGPHEPRRLVAEPGGERFLNVEEKPVKSNELIIPRGGENTVILADGTTVHLNAGSKLTYPVRFAGKRRIVALEGEAYFEVVQDESHPFVVQTHLGEVMVLGTAFNVNAYTDASVCYTTLVHGKVQFSAPNVGTVTLQPGEQAVVSANGTEKRTVDLDEYIGWVNGVYNFKNRSLGEIMETFERWYDIQVYYETPDLRDITYSGSLKRYGAVNSFLDALELTGDLTYKISGRKVLIYDGMKE